MFSVSVWIHTNERTKEETDARCVCVCVCVCARVTKEAINFEMSEVTGEATNTPPTYNIGEGPYALNEDDTAVDPVAFREALLNDAEKLKMIESDEELAKAMLGEDTGAMQRALKRLMTMSRNAAEAESHSDMHSNEIMRARCTVPRDPTVLYQGMLRAGLQYGPSFRLLSQVWIPESLDAKQRADQENIR